MPYGKGLGPSTGRNAAGVIGVLTAFAVIVLVLNLLGVL